MKYVFLCLILLSGILLPAQMVTTSSARDGILHIPGQRLNSSAYRLIELRNDNYDKGLFLPHDSVYYYYGILSEEGHNDFDFVRLDNLLEAPWMANGEYFYNLGSGWINYVKFYNTFYPDGLREKLTLDLWDGDSYEPSSRVIYAYDDQDRVVTKTDEYYSGGWFTNGLLTYTYDADLLVSVLDQYWSGSEFVNSLLNVYTYTTGGALDYLTINYWDGANWQPTYRYVYMYDIEGILTEILEQTYSGGWDNFQRTQFAYDGTGFNHSTTVDFWDVTDWTPIIQYENTEFMDKLPATESLSTWDGSVWQPEYLYSFKYEMYDDGLASLEDAMQLQAAVYPNPAAETAYVELPWQETSVVELMTTDGRLISQQLVHPELEATVAIDLHGLAPGTYLVVISRGQQHAVAPLIIAE